MLTDYKNIFIIFLPIFIAFYILVNNCRLNPKTVSLIVFILFTFPVLLILGAILYYHINNVSKYKTKESCMNNDYKKYGNLLCNTWDENENKCYIGSYDDKNNTCNRNILKNTPISLYIASAFIILVNIYFHNMKSKCY